MRRLAVSEISSVIHDVFINAVVVSFGLTSGFGNGHAHGLIDVFDYVSIKVGRYYYLLFLHTL